MSRSLEMIGLLPILHKTCLSRARCYFCIEDEASKMGAGDGLPKKQLND